MTGKVAPRSARAFRPAITTRGPQKPATVNFDPEVVVDGFRRSLAQMQQHVIWWMQEVVLRHLHTKRLAEVDFIPLLNKVTSSFA